MKVWTVEEGENHEGGSIIAICASQATARRIAAERFAEWHWDDKQQDGPDNWSGGCDWLSISECDVVE